MPEIMYTGLTGNPKLEWEKRFRFLADFNSPDLLPDRLPGQECLYSRKMRSQFQSLYYDIQAKEFDKLKPTGGSTMEADDFLFEGIYS